MKKSIWQKKEAAKLFKKSNAKYPNSNPKLIDKKIAFMNLKKKKGQLFMIGILFVIMALLVFIATLPAIKDLINDVQGCNSLNCAGYIDADATAGVTCSATNQTYQPSLKEDSLSCTVIDLMIPFLILGILTAIIYKITTGNMVDAPPQSNPYGYQ